MFLDEKSSCSFIFGFLSCEYNMPLQYLTNFLTVFSHLKDFLQNQWFSNLIVSKVLFWLFREQRWEPKFPSKTNLEGKVVEVRPQLARQETRRAVKAQVLDVFGKWIKLLEGAVIVSLDPDGVQDLAIDLRVVIALQQNFAGEQMTRCVHGVRNIGRCWCCAVSRCRSSERGPAPSTTAPGKQTISRLRQ